MLEDYVPKCVKAGKFSGKLTLKLLSFDERFDLMDKATNIDKTQHAKFTRELVKEFKPRFAAVDLTRVADGKVFKSYDDLQYGPECHAVLVDAAMWILNGDDAAEKTSGP